MSSSRLRFNPSKTEFMWLGAGHLLQQVDIGNIPVLSSTVKVVQSARDLGVILDNQLSLCDHIAAICRAGFYQLLQIRPAIQSLTFDAAKTIVQAFIACRLDWCNSLLYSVPENLLRSRCRTLPLVYLPTLGDATTSLRCCDNFIGCRSRDEWSSRLRVLYTNRWLQRRRCTYLRTFILPPSMVAISAHLHIDHLLFHGREPPSVTEASLSQDHACGTVCRLHHQLRTV